MITIEKSDVFGWESAIRGLRNPMNSWDKSDSCFCPGEFRCINDCPVCIGEADLTLMKRLVAYGSDHRKFMRMINVTCDVTAPLYWWKEYDTYKVGTVANSCSTMHKIQAKIFTLDDFSHEHLLESHSKHDEPLDVLRNVVAMLNHYREAYLRTSKKEYWWQMIQLLPSSYNQKRTIQLNYEVLSNIYRARHSHKLDEWLDFCKWIETLPYSELITKVEVK